MNAATVAEARRAADEQVQAEMARIRALNPWERADAAAALLLDDASMFAVLAAKYREPQ